ncbi:OmpA family protein [Paraflavisolibacter sp. H34]|uniref:OmpA family protein n=1 Tax=Huijunlia imazamoxiresistens TaxID=3127457 RepID=UPI0030178380
MVSRTIFIAATAWVVLLTSCVSQKKYRAALDRNQQLEAEATKLNSSINELNSRVTSLDNERARLAKQGEDARKNAAALAGQANLTQQQLEAQQKRLADMQRILDQQRQMAENLRKKMADALVGFSAKDLTVTTKNGKVYVSLQENLLFPSGSAVVNPKGKDALGTLAQVLNSNPDINVLIEGHTDSIPIRGKYEDNWALSVARSTAIVRILVNNYGVFPTRVTASGRSLYDPVDTNSTPDGRQRNRRTEIILAPKLDELMKLMEENQNQAQ